MECDGLKSREFVGMEFGGCKMLELGVCRNAIYRKIVGGHVRFCGKLAWDMSQNIVRMI